MSFHENKKYAAKTICVTSGTEEKVVNSITTPVYLSSTFRQYAPAQTEGYDYGRTHNPTRTSLENAYAQIEAADYGIAVCSGMAAELVILHSIPHQSSILASDHQYGGTYRLLSRVFQHIHKTDFADFTDLGEIEKQIQQKEYQYFWIESPTNPLMRIVNIEGICSLAKQYNIKVIVDNTLATPVAQKPLLLGADVVFHSSTKYINGHSDVIAGAIMTSDKDWYTQLDFIQNSIGTTPSPFDCWLILRGIRTLEVRMKQHEENALALATWLEKHPKVERVLYPGLPSHPQHTLAKKQMQNFSGMIVFDVKGTQEETVCFLKKLKLLNLAVSLGGVETLIEQPYAMTHGSVPEALKKTLGIKPTTIRVSVGLEDVVDLIADIEQAFASY